MNFVRSQLATGSYGYLDGLPKLALKPDDFDEANAKVLVRGNRDTLNNLFPQGSKTSGISDGLFCTGATVEREQWGHVWADVAWKGLVGGHDMIFNHTVTTRETMWPQTIDGVTYYVPGTMIGKSANVNPANGEYWRVRLIDQLSGVSVRGVAKGTVISPPAPPAVTVGALGGGSIGGKFVTALARPQSFSGLIHPVYNAPKGWVLKNYDIQQTVALGNGEALYFWNANYDWAYEYGP
jgi:hypothetical protein